LIFSQNFGYLRDYFALLIEMCQNEGFSNKNSTTFVCISVLLYHRYLENRISVRI
jgi:hypothetical protein